MAFAKTSIGAIHRAHEKEFAGLVRVIDESGYGRNPGHYSHIVAKISSFRSTARARQNNLKLQETDQNVISIASGTVAGLGILDAGYTVVKDWLEVLPANVATIVSGAVVAVGALSYYIYNRLNVSNARETHALIEGDLKLLREHPKNAAESLERALR